MDYYAMTLDAKPHNDRWIIRGSDTAKQHVTTGDEISVNERIQYWTGDEWNDHADRAIKFASEAQANEYIDKHPYVLKRYSA